MSEECKKPHLAWIISGQMERHDEDDWCEKCFKPSRCKGNVYKLCDDGASPYGIVEGCHGCNFWKFTNHKGEVRMVDGNAEAAKKKGKKS